MQTATLARGSCFRVTTNTTQVVPDPAPRGVSGGTPIHWSPRTRGTPGVGTGRWTSTYRCRWVSPGPTSPHPPSPAHLFQSPHRPPTLLHLGGESGGRGAEVLAGHGQELGHAELLGHGAGDAGRGDTGGGTGSARGAAAGWNNGNALDGCTGSAPRVPARPGSTPHARPRQLRAVPGSFSLRPPAPSLPAAVT